MCCTEKGCVWPAENEGLCAIHFRNKKEEKLLRRPYYDTGHTEFVLIRGEVYKTAEKAPFVISGVSFCGAIEYDAARDFLRCHECGEFFENLGVHIAYHEMNQQQYREKHGISLKTPLANTRLRDIRKTAAIERKQWTTSNAIFKKGNRSTPVGQKKNYLELMNARGNCKAQTLEKLSQAAIQMGRRPTQRELVDFDINWMTIRKYFGSMGKAMELAGIPEDVPDCECVKCGYKWFSKKGIPEKCPNTPCQTKFWKQPQDNQSGGASVHA